MLIPELEQFAVIVEDEETLRAIYRYINSLIPRRTQKNIVTKACTTGRLTDLTEDEVALVTEVNGYLTSGRIAILLTHDPGNSLGYTFIALSPNWCRIPYLGHCLLQPEPGKSSFWLRQPVAVAKRLYTLKSTIGDDFVYTSKEGRWCTIVTQWEKDVFLRAYVAGTDTTIYNIITTDDSDA